MKDLLLTNEQEEYLAWLLTPEDQRQPQTKKEWALAHDLHVNTLGQWEKKKNFRERWQLGIEALNQSPERTQKLLEALYIKGISGDTKSAELYLKATGSMPSQTLNIKQETSVKDLSQEDLEGLILEISKNANKKDAKIIPANFKVGA